MDCDTSPEEVIDRCRQSGINCIAVADHGTVEGALKMQNLSPFPIIIAEEILTPHGEIMGMFLKEGIPSGLSIEETISRIKDQEGLVCIPHPFDRLRHSAMDGEIIEELVAQGQIDVIDPRVIRDGSMTGSKMLPYVLNDHYNVDIDNESNWKEAEEWLEETNLPIVRPE